MKRIPAALFAALALAFAGSGARPADAQPRQAPAAACAPVPALALLPGFRDPRRRFAPGTAAYQATARNFAAAWRRSCARGVLRGVAAWERLYLRNAPHANVAQIARYPDGRVRAYSRRLSLEYPFVTEDGAAHAPSADELTEAIYCHVRGATPQEQEASGRCLPD